MPSITSCLVYTYSTSAYVKGSCEYIQYIMNFTFQTLNCG